MADSRPRSNAAAKPALTAATPLRYLKGVGPQGAAQLARLGLRQVEDLLFHLPLRYEDRTRLTPLTELREGEPAVCILRVEASAVRFGRRRSLLVSASDGARVLQLRFFHFNASQQSALATGQWLQVFGTPRLGAQGLEMVHPEYRLLATPEAAQLSPHLTPVYPVMEGIGQNRLRKLIQQAVELLTPDFLADGLMTLLHDGTLPGLHEALLQLHCPRQRPGSSMFNQCNQAARQRLALEELVAQQLAARARRQTLRREMAVPLAGDTALRRSLRATLPFRLTNAQVRVLREITADLGRSVPMLRLVQGDVGSGKTLVAAETLLAAVECGQQAAMMAPTELLAEQHFRVLRQWFSPLGVEVVLLSGALSVVEKRRVLEAIAAVQAAVVVGTHALFQEEVRFARLALCVIDEQHRFGVHQRLALRGKGALPPHQLILTATPIPRTLAMSLYADLDISVLDELPPGRQPITTVAIADDRRGEVVERIAAACRRGEQVYWVCTLVEESEQLDAEAAEATAELLQQQLPGVAIGLVHGRLKSVQKEAVMSAFRAGEVQLLVATTVIEVGVDVPNASLMVIENAERLGLSQLHQLRGRVGRGTRASFCVLMYRAPLSGNARERLKVMRETTDGFRVAQRDLELRGPGELLGAKQSGLASLKIADLARDGELLPRAQTLADHLLESKPALVEPLLRRWLGQTDHYLHA